MNLFESELFVQGHRIAPGFGKISGTAPNGIVTKAGIPARCVVQLLHGRSKILMMQTASANDGTYEFLGLDPNQKFIVIAYDPENQFNAVIRDNITPAPMP